MDLTKFNPTDACQITRIEQSQIYWFHKSDLQHVYKIQSHITYMVDKDAERVLDAMDEIQNMIPSDLNESDVVPMDVQDKIKAKAQDLLDKL